MKFASRYEGISQNFIVGFIKRLGNTASGSTGTRSRFQEEEKYKKIKILNCAVIIKSAATSTNQKINIILKHHVS